MKTPDDFIDPRLSKKLDHLQDVPPRDPAARARGRTNFLAEVETAAASGRSAQPVQPSRWNRPIFVINMRTAAMALGLLLGLTVLLAFGGSAVTAYAQTALPGDFLYGLKSASEDARVTLSADAGAVAELHLQFAERRIDEIRGLINQGRYENIALAAREYESHIYQALGAVGLLAADDPARAEAITVTIFNSLADYTAALVVLRETVPVGQPQTALEKAVNASSFQYSDDNFEFTGQVEAMGDDRWTIGGRGVVLTADTKIEGLLAIGDLASVHARVDRDGSLIARKIEPASEKDESPEEDVEFAGVVARITPDQWTVSGRLVSITPATEIEGNIIVGNLVKVEGYLDEKGSLIAQEIALVEDGPEDNSNEDSDDEHSDNGSPEGTDNGGEDDEEDDEEPSTNEGGGDEGGSSGEDNDSGDDGDDPGSNEGDDNPGGDDPDENENEGDNDEDSPDDEAPPDDDDTPDNEDPPDEEDPPDNGD